MIKGMIHGGRVQHLCRENDKSVCGRYVVTAGESNAPMCRTCVRITGYETQEVPTNDAQSLIDGCNSDHNHVPVATLVQTRWNGTQLGMFRDVLDDYAKGGSNHACWIGTLMLILDKPNLAADVRTGELSKRQGGHNPNAGLIDPNSKSKARTPFAGSAKQLDLIHSLIGQINEITAEIYPDVKPLEYAEEYISSLSTQAKVRKDIEGLFDMLRVIKEKAKSKRAEVRQAEAKEIKSSREWRRNQVYVIDGIYHRVHISQSTGRPYTQSWNPQSEEWVYQGAKFLKACTDATACTAAQAKAWAHEHDNCVFCHKPLDDQRSRNAGYGSTCADNNGLPWGE